MNKEFANKYIRNLQPYKLASHKIWNVGKEERRTILKLDWNEATIPPSPMVKLRISDIINNEEIYNLYPSTFNTQLLTLLSEYLKLPEENIQYFGSSDTLHEYIVKVYTGVGDTVLMLGPSYDNFRLTCQSNGATVKYSMYTDDFKFDEDVFVNDIVKLQPACVYICNPNNPTGNLHSTDYIEVLLNKFPDTLFIIDEAYAEFSETSAKHLVLQYENILISRTMSKAFALANFRIGYLIASRKTIQLIDKVRNPKNVSTIAQEAAIGALMDIDYMREYVREVNTAKEYFIHTIKSKDKGYFRFYNSNGNFLLIRMISENEKKRFCAYLAENNIFVREMSQSSVLMNCFRITIGTMSQMQVVISVFKTYIEAHEGSSI
jgi:histidinol-phosphate aminotransferase